MREGKGASGFCSSLSLPMDLMGSERRWVRTPQDPTPKICERGCTPPSHHPWLCLLTHWTEQLQTEQTPPALPHPTIPLIPSSCPPPQAAPASFSQLKPGHPHPQHIPALLAAQPIWERNSLAVQSERGIKLLHPHNDRFLEM